MNFKKKWTEKDCPSDCLFLSLNMIVHLTILSLNCSFIHISVCSFVFSTAENIETTHCMSLFSPKFFMRCLSLAVVISSI